MLYPKIDKKNDQKWEKKKGLSAFETAPSFTWRCFPFTGGGWIRAPQLHTDHGAYLNRSTSPGRSLERNQTIQYVKNKLKS
jgi:hypothetical protein